MHKEWTGTISEQSFLREQAHKDALHAVAALNALRDKLPKGDADKIMYVHYDRDKRTYDFTIDAGFNEKSLEHLRLFAGNHYDRYQRDGEAILPGTDVGGQVMKLKINAHKLEEALDIAQPARSR